MSDFLWWNAVDQRRAVQDGDISVRELVAAHIAQIETRDADINAVVTRSFEAALQQADQADRQLRQGEASGVLFGLAVAHKDTFPTAGMRTTYGSPIFAQSIPVTDHVVVARQKAAGAITLGKTNVPEFAAGSHTYNPVFGATHNPYDLSRSAGGSSGGAAAALASGFVSLADGSDMGGSLRNPASFCNVVGLRPSPGCVPNYPSAMTYNALSVAGPMGRSVRDVGLLLSALAGEHPHDPLSYGLESRSFTNLQERSCKGVRVAVSHTLGGLPVQPSVRKALDEGVVTLTDMGCIVEQAEPDLSGADEVFETLRALSFLTSYGPLRTSDGDRMKESVLWNIDMGLALTGEQVSRAERERTRLLQRAHEFWDTYEFLVAPVSQVVPFAVQEEFPQSIDGVEMENYISWMRSLSRVTVLGVPAISVPCSFSDEGLPIGIQIVTRPRHEHALLCFALAFETAKPAGLRRPVAGH